jgi:hypothetical protein
MRAKIRTVAVNMTAYPSVRKPARDAPEPIELEFARDRLSSEQHVQSGTRKSERRRYRAKLRVVFSGVHRDG